jgi:fructokinase
MSLYGGIESGGSKWECAVGTGPDDVRAHATIPTTTPEETLERVTEFFAGEGPIDALGIGSFGPVDAHRGSPTWGYITTTPKPGWANTSVGQELQQRLGVPVVFDTDVNAAAFGECRWGAGRGLSSLWYVTVGTGIGGGAVVDGKILSGRSHPEFGHLRVPRDPAIDPFAGSCVFHGDCLEGLASGTALEARWGSPASEIEGEGAWALEARYLALGLLSVVAVLSPERIVVGGGVARRQGLLADVRTQLASLVNGYDGFEPAEDFVTAPALGSRSGVLGAIALAAAAG